MAYTLLVGNVAKDGADTLLAAACRHVQRGRAIDAWLCADSSMEAAG
jgi:hypothetical protein